MSELPKTFDPAAIEQRWYEHWESKGLFRPDRPDEEPWTIVMPPPNVTGSLHIGHALDNTLQDVLTRRERMRGKDALWVVGTDHAGIATQMVVERNLESQGVRRAEIGREAFLLRRNADIDQSFIDNRRLGQDRGRVRVYLCFPVQRTRVLIDRKQVGAI